jgi:hypothetical protein
MRRQRTRPGRPTERSGRRGRERAAFPQIQHCSGEPIGSGGSLVSSDSGVGSAPAAFGHDSGSGIQGRIEMGQAGVCDRRQQLDAGGGRRAAASAGFVDAGPAGQPTRPRGTPAGHREAEPGSPAFDEP